MYLFCDQFFENVKTKAPVVEGNEVRNVAGAFTRASQQSVTDAAPMGNRLLGKYKGIISTNIDGLIFFFWIYFIKINTSKDTTNIQG